MKKLLLLFLAVVLVSSTCFASTGYIPSDESSEYLPTVKIFAYSVDYAGNLIPEGYGSGTLIDSEGVVLTNNHVIQNYYDPALPNDAFQVCLTKSNEPENPICEFTASLITRDTTKDAALLKIDSKDVSGQKVDFDFFLPYENDSDFGVADKITAIGYPDTGGRTITYTSGTISGFITEVGIKYIKTDADISFGNSGGTAVDADGNFIGIPTYIMGSYSAEVLGYLLPVSEIKSWIKENENNDVSRNDVADAELKAEMLANVNANKSGTYKNDYPPYEISIVDGWKFGNSLEGAFDGAGYGSYYGSESVVLYPSDALTTGSLLYVEVSVTDYAYEVTLDDIKYFLGVYAEGAAVQGYDNTGVDEDGIVGMEEVTFNGYSAIKDSYSYMDWWTGANVNTVTYYIPYGNQVINVLYNYGDANTIEDIAEIDTVLASFKVDMTKAVSNVVDVVESTNPAIKVKNVVEGMYLSDTGYEYDGVYYFGVSLGKKKDYSLSIGIYSNVYWDETLKGDFAKFKETTLSDAILNYDVVASGTLKLDGHEGFFFTDQYDNGFGDITVYTTIYIDNGADSYFSVTYTALEESYKENMSSFKKILKNVTLDNGGTGKYLIPNLYVGGVSAVLSDIKDYVYEDSIKNLNKKSVFGDKAPEKFEPANSLTRADFLTWAVKDLVSSNVATEFVTFEAGFVGCEVDCFSDVDASSILTMYLEFAREKGAVSGMNAKGKYTFAPDSQISLMAALKILFELNDYDVWAAPSFIPWYIPYLQLAYKLDILPYGVTDVNYLLTRGEGAYLIDALVSYAGGNYYSPELLPIIDLK